MEPTSKKQSKSTAMSVRSSRECKELEMEAFVAVSAFEYPCLAFAINSGSPVRRARCASESADTVNPKQESLLPFSYSVGMYSIYPLAGDSGNNTKSLMKA